MDPFTTSAAWVFWMGVFVVLAVLVVLVALRQVRSLLAPCAAQGQPGVYQLGLGEELVIVSYPGPPRADVPHGLGAPTLLPIVTVTNRTGSVDVVVEAWPHEHWYGPPGAPALPSQPETTVCLQDNLAFAKVYPEEGQPGIERHPSVSGATDVRVEVRPIYFVALGGAQSTTVYAEAPGAWIRLRAGKSGARGAYCVSWCCPEDRPPRRPEQPRPPRPPVEERMADPGAERV